MLRIREATHQPDTTDGQRAVAALYALRDRAREQYDAFDEERDRINERETELFRLMDEAQQTITDAERIVAILEGRA